MQIGVYIRYEPRMRAQYLLYSLVYTSGTGEGRESSVLFLIYVQSGVYIRHWRRKRAQCYFMYSLVYTSGTGEGRESSVLLYSLVYTSGTGRGRERYVGYAVWCIHQVRTEDESSVFLYSLVYASGTGEGRESSVLLYVQSGVYEFSIITQFGVYIRY